MALQGELFPDPEVVITPDDARREPLVWVSRLVIWEKSGGEILREVPLRRGLNVIGRLIQALTKRRLVEMQAAVMGPARLYSAGCCATAWVKTASRMMSSGGALHSNCPLAL